MHNYKNILTMKNVNLYSIRFLIYIADLYFNHVLIVNLFRNVSKFVKYLVRTSVRTLLYKKKKKIKTALQKEQEGMSSFFHFFFYRF